MPFFTHHKQHSWPPFRTSSSAHQPETLSASPTSRPGSFSRSSSEKNQHGADVDMDMNPFSYFISPAVSESDTDSDDDKFSDAGITLGKARSRSISPLPRRRSETEISFYDEQFQTPQPRSPKSVLNRFIEKHVHHIDVDDEDIGGPLTRSKSFSSSLSSMASGSGRGRSDPDYHYDLYSFGTSPRKNSPPSQNDAYRKNERITLRSHSPKPRSWKEPSYGLWPVAEDVRREEEESQIARNIHERGKDVPRRRKTRKGSAYLFAQSI